MSFRDEALAPDLEVLPVHPFLIQNTLAMYILHSQILTQYLVISIF